MRWGLFAFLVLFFCFPNSYYETFGGLFRLEKIEVAMISEVGDEPFLRLGQPIEYWKGEIIEAIRVHENNFLMTLTDASLAETLSDIPWVYSVSFRRLFPSQLKISVRMHTPTAVIWYDGGFFPMNSIGEIYERLPNVVLPDLPILRGDVFHYDNEKRHTALVILETFKLETGNTSALISEIYWRAMEGYSVYLTHPQVEINLGMIKTNIPHWERELSKTWTQVLSVLQYVSEKELIGRVIDAQFPKKILVRARKGS